MDRERWRGEIAYLGADGVLTGREIFSVSVHGDGAQTLRSQCEMDDDALVRDAILALDARGWPAEAFVRIVERGAAVGSRWYRFGETGDGAPAFFGTHSLINDGWLARLGRDMTPGATCRLGDMLTCSKAANGGGVPGLYETSASLVRLGDETIAVPSGEFDCRHWRVGYGDHPPLDMWVSGALDLLVLLEWPHLGGRYELVALERLR